MGSSCKANGEVCTKCCEAIHIIKTKSLVDVIKGNAKSRPSSSDLGFVMRYWHSISAEEAEYINPHPFLSGAFRQFADDDGFAFFRCDWLTKEGCGCYFNRPSVCRGYPAYEGELSFIQRTLEAFPDGEYTENCKPFNKMRKNAVIFNKNQVEGEKCGG